jgi:O-antigen/teichoic acid export membrane protein
LLGRRSLLLFISRMLASAIAFIGLLFMTNYLGRDVYGSIVWTLSLVASFNAISDLGFTNAHIKKISEGKDLDDCVSTYAVIKLTLTGVMAVITLTSVFLWTDVLGKTLESSSTDLILLFILYYVLLDISSIATNTFMAKMEMAKLPLVIIIDPLVRVPLIVIVSINLMGMVELALAYVLSALAVAVLALFLLFRDRIKWRRPSLVHSYSRFALPLALIAVISVLSGLVDKLLLGSFYGSGAVGLYSAPQVFLGTFAIVSTAVSALTFPSFSKLHAEGKLREIRELTRQAERYIMMVALPITILIIMFPEDICVVLYGSDFADAGEIIGIMAVTNLILMMNSVDSSQIIAVNRPGRSALITVIVFLVNLGALLVLVPDSTFLGFGLGLSYVGAAIALLIGRVVSYVITRYTVWHLTGTVLNPRLLIQLVAGAVVIGLLMVLSMMFSITTWYWLIAYGFITLGTYIGVLVLLKEFTRRDLRYFLDLVNPKELSGYIRGELKGGQR